MKSELEKRAKAGDDTFSHFSFDANNLSQLEQLFKIYGKTGTGQTREYVHDSLEAERYGVEPGHFTFYEILSPIQIFCFTKVCMAP